jgi:hypothetical protein
VQEYIITAKKQAAMYEELGQKARVHLKEALGHKVVLEDGETFIDYIHHQREEYREIIST